MTKVIWPNCEAAAWLIVSHPTIYHLHHLLTSHLRSWNMLPIFAPAPTWPFPMLDIHPTLDQLQYFSATDDPWSTGSVWPRENSSLECMRSGGRVHLSAEDLLEDLLRMHEGTRREIYCEGKSQSSQLHLAHLLPCWRAGKSSLQVVSPAGQSRDKQAWWSRSAHKPSTLVELQLVVGCTLV